MSGLLNKLTHHNKNQATVTGTDLNRDGIPDQLQGGSRVVAGQTIQQTTTNTTHIAPTTVHQPIVHETTTYVAPVVQETVRQDRIVEVQPVVHREVDRNVVHHVEKHIREAPAPSIGGTVERAAVVDTNVVTNVIHEVQPVIHRERVVPVVSAVQAHYAQRVVEPTVHTHEVVYDTTIYPAGQAGLVNQQTLLQQQQLGQRAPLASVSGPDRNHDGIPDQLQGGQRFGQQAFGAQQASISGPDRNHDGIPDQLQGGQRLGQQPFGAQQASISGPDRNHDGIPDQLQGGQQQFLGKPGLNQQGLPLQQPQFQQAGGLAQPRAF